MSDYKRQLQNPLWQKKRLEILSRDGFKCKACFKDDMELHVHHKYYLSGKHAWEYPDECYETLCYQCHQYEGEKVKERSTELIQVLKESGANAFIFSYSIAALSDLNKTTLYDCIEAIHQIKFLQKRGSDILSKISAEYYKELEVFMAEKHSQNKQHAK